MTEDQRELLEKARSSPAAAKWLIEGAYPDFAASRVYYVMFYVAQAFLEGESLAFSKHSAVIAAFGQHFALPVESRLNFIVICLQPRTCGIVVTMVHYIPSRSIKLESRSLAPRHSSAWPKASWVLYRHLPTGLFEKNSCPQLLSILRP